MKLPEQLGAEADFQEFVGQYLDNLEDQAYMNAGIQRWGFAGLWQGLSALLVSPDIQTMSDVSLLARDLVLIGPPLQREALIASYRESALPSRFEWHVLNGTHHCRRQSAYALGKTCHEGSAAVLRDAAFKWLERDPLCLKDLLFEIGWLGGGKAYHELIAAMAESPSHFTRWALLDMIPDSPNACSAARAPELWVLAKRLSADLNPFVREEAQFRLGMQQKEPSITFWHLGLWFTNDRCARGAPDYSVAELQAFLESDAPRFAQEHAEWLKRKPPKKQRAPRWRGPGAASV